MKNCTFSKEEKAVILILHTTLALSDNCPLIHHVGQQIKEASLFSLFSNISAAELVVSQDVVSFK